MIDLSSVIDFSLYRSKALVNSSHLFNLTINSVIFEEKLSVNIVCFLSLDPVCILCSVSFGLIDLQKDLKSSISKIDNCRLNFPPISIFILVKNSLVADKAGIVLKLLNL
uniref:Orf:PZA109 protein n=1 Tax=Saccharomyces cerevisiae TaxID=4932 RepID=E9PAB8_YEASX|nr:orf:PZA109 [Saccharomyces cerevisiae]